MNKERGKIIKSRPFLCVDLLNTFSKKEIENLRYIVSCRYFNTDRYVVKLLEVLKKYVLNKRTFTEEVQQNVYRKVFDDLPASGGSLDKKQKGLLNVKMSVLLRLAEQLLSMESMGTHHNNCELLYPKLIERQQSLLFNRHINKLRKTLEDETVQGIEYYNLNYKLMYSIINHTDSLNKGLDLSDFSELEHHLDMYYLLNKLEIHIGVLSLLRALNDKTYDFSSISAIVALLELPQYAKHPLIAVCRANIDLEKNRTDKTYFYLLDMLDKYGDDISPNRLRSFYTNAANYCISQIRAGNQSYNRHIFMLYKVMHDKNLLINNGVVSIQILKNIVTMACRESEFEWAEMLISYYEGFISKSVKESVCHFNYGVIAFHQKDYETAHDRFIQVDKINLNYDINTRVLILKCLYEKEKEYNEYTMTAFRSAEKFFKLNKQLPQRNKKGYINFIKILITLYRVRHREGVRTLEWTEEQLEEQEFNSDKRWLLEKIEELKGRKQRSW